MKKFWIATLVLILILGALAIFYFDIFDLRYSKEAVIASIISAEDTRRVSARIIESLSSPDPEIRARAALAIGRIGDAGAVTRLFELAEDSVAEVAETAVFAIGLSGDSANAARLLEISRDFEPGLLAIAVESIGRLADSTMIDIVNELPVFLDHLDHRVREQAAYALWRAGAREAWNELVDISRNDPVRPVQVAALYALVRMGIKEPTDLYSEWLPDSDPYVRLLAIRGLGLSRDNSVISLIASGLNDRDNNVVAQAISSLASVASPKAVRFLVSRYANTTDEKLKVLLLESFSRMDNGGIADYALDDIHDDSSSINIKSAAIVYLSKIRKEIMIPLIDSLIDLNDRYLNANIARALKEIGGENVKPRLMSLFNDSTAMVRAAAFEALCTVDNANLDYYLKTALADNDYVVVSRAVEKIGQKKKAAYLPQLATIMKLQRDAEIDLKRAIIFAAAEFLSDGIDSTAEDILYHALLGHEYLVSREAAELYQKKLGVDKSAFINLPLNLIGERKIKSLIGKYKKNPRATVYTNRGEFETELYFDMAPLTVYNFIRLSNKGFYDNLTFHRLVPGFVVQGGDPRGDGWGGPGYTIRCELNNLAYKRGSVGMALSGRDSGGSQFFVTLMPQPHLDARFTQFGKVINGMAVANEIVRGDTIRHIRIVEAKE
jgi:cyclophilin family peptidyl-prolyl cis-trans isomerase/HEAT repeat protein